MLCLDDALVVWTVTCVFDFGGFVLMSGYCWVDLWVVYCWDFFCRCLLLGLHDMLLFVNFGFRGL